MNKVAKQYKFYIERASNKFSFFDADKGEKAPCPLRPTDNYYARLDYDSKAQAWTITMSDMDDLLGFLKDNCCQGEIVLELVRDPVFWRPGIILQDLPIIIIYDDFLE